jgi:iron complex transport system substrate-binding protein
MRGVGFQQNLLRAGLLTGVLCLVAFGLGAEVIAGEASAATTAAYDSRRVVSIGGSLTEILYALGAQQRIAAVDTTSLYPPDALKDKPNVGYMRQLSAEGVLALSPTLILALQGSGPKEAIDVLQQAGVAFVTIPDKFTADGIVEKIRMVPQDVGLQARGECIAGRVEQDTAALDNVRKRIRQRVRVAFVPSLANGRPMIAGRNTAADGIIAMAGADNAFADFDGYKMVNDEAVVAAKPDAVLVMQRTGLALTADEIFAQSGLAMTPAAGRKAFVSMEGLYLLGFGPRTAQAARDLARQLYPGITIAKLPSEKDVSATQCDR